MSISGNLKTEGTPNAHVEWLNPLGYTDGLLSTTGCMSPEPGGEQGKTSVHHRIPFLCLCHIKLFYIGAVATPQGTAEGELPECSVF
jgi:hypothetical protein